MVLEGDERCYRPPFVYYTRMRSNVPLSYGINARHISTHTPLARCDLRCQLVIFVSTPFLLTHLRNGFAYP